ncbi:MAG: hypothetical protein ACO32I_09625, partial [Candidatus Limnocylindrus sp.]
MRMAGRTNRFSNSSAGQTPNTHPGVGRMRYIMEMEKEEGERIAATGQKWTVFNSLDHVPIVGEIARLGQTITAAIQGDGEQVKDAATNLGYNLAA